MKTSYSEHFQDPSAASAYDNAEYARGSYSDVLWALEKEQLADVIRQLRQTHARIECLDFAAGSGRISAFLENEVDALTSIEISAAMCARAREKLKKTNVVCADITSAGATIEGRYDLITAFRFILNAEPALRLAGVRALAQRLRDPGSVLAINNHGNLWSIKLLFWPYHRLKRIGKGRAPAGNYLTHRQVVSLFRQSGLRVREVIGAGVLGARCLSFLSPEAAIRLERRLSASPVLRRFCVNQLYLVTQDTSPSEQAASSGPDASVQPTQKADQGR